MAIFPDFLCVVDYSAKPFNCFWILDSEANHFLVGAPLLGAWHLAWGCPQSHKGSLAGIRAQAVWGEPASWMLHYVSSSSSCLTACPLEMKQWANWNNLLVSQLVPSALRDCCADFRTSIFPGWSWHGERRLQPKQRFSVCIKSGIAFNILLIFLIILQVNCEHPPAGSCLSAMWMTLLYSISWIILITSAANKTCAMRAPLLELTRQLSVLPP